MSFQYEINLMSNLTSLCRHAEPLDTDLIIERMEFYAILRMSDYKPVKIECHSRLLQQQQQQQPPRGERGEENIVESSRRGGISLSYPRRNKIRKLAE